MRSSELPALNRRQARKFFLTDAANGIFFDINGDGRRERIGWTKAGSTVGFLVLDRNGNGTIDDGSELFGTATVKNNGLRARNGFDALIDLDGGPTRTDGRIDPSDSAYFQMRVWYDLNHDGVSQQNELRTLTEEGITGIALAYTPLKRSDGHGNIYMFRGGAYANEAGTEALKRIIDVNFAKQ